MNLLSPQANPTERRRVTLRYHGSKIFGSQQEARELALVSLRNRTAGRRRRQNAHV